MPKQRIHNEWFMPIVKTSCMCGAKKVEMFAWGEYSCGKWRTITHFCQGCFEKRVLSQLIAHAAPCGCSFKLNVRSGYGALPTFIKAGEAVCNLKAA